MRPVLNLLNLLFQILCKEFVQRLKRHRKKQRGNYDNEEVLDYQSRNAAVAQQREQSHFEK